MRILATIAMSVPIGAALWWLAAVAGATVCVGMDFSLDISLIPGLLYSYLALGTVFALKFGYIGLPVSIGIVAVLTTMVAGRRGR